MTTDVTAHLQVLLFSVPVTPLSQPCSKSFFIVEKLPNASEQRWRTHYGQHCEPFSVKTAIDCRILHI